jgi:hypothetical protein
LEGLKGGLSVVRLLLATALLCITAHTIAQTTSRDPASATGTSEHAAAGKVALVEGDVRFLDGNRRMRRPGSGEPIYEGESIVTGTDGEVHLQMEDGGYVAVRPATRMRIVNFRAEGDAEDRSIIALLEGSFRSVTGWIAKSGRDRAVVRTPTATIGIRGTEHEPLVIPAGSALGEPGTYDRVHFGETEIRTKQGVVAVRPNQAGFVPFGGAQRPRVLDRIPAFFRATRNEARFSGLHERVNRQLDQRREERRRVIEERRKVQPEHRDKGKSTRAAGESKGAQSERRREKSDRAEHEKKQGAPDARQAARRQSREEKKGDADELKRERAEHNKGQKGEHLKGGK